MERAEIRKSTGQNVDVWSKEWDTLSVESEIRMWDYFGMRQWILKYMPRHGDVLEAGCGLGRYNFYLSHFGISMIGLDFSKTTIDHLNKWKEDHGYNLSFIDGDIKQLPFLDNSLAGYLSLGVVEHLIEGPSIPIREAFRVLRPGGIAVITTPAPSWSKRYFNVTKKIKRNIKVILGRKRNKPPFFQYEYSHKKLKGFVEKEGFHISTYKGGDWLYTFTEFGRQSDRFIKPGGLGFWLSHKLECRSSSSLGAQSVVIAVKKADQMYCFLCGKKNTNLSSLDFFDVPICSNCENLPLSDFYRKGQSPKFHNKYLINPLFIRPEEHICEYCHSKYHSDPLFENFGLTVRICKSCLLKSDNSIQVSNTSIQPIWRSR